MPAVIGDIPNVIVPDFKLGRYAVFPVCAIFTVSTVFTVLAINAIFAIGTILSVSAGVAFVALVAFLAGCLYAEGSPALPAVIGDIPNVIVPDFKPGRYAVFSVCAVFTVSTVFTRSAVFAGGAIFTGGTVLSVNSVFAILSVCAGGFYAEGKPCLTFIIGNFPLVTFGIDTKP